MEIVHLALRTEFSFKNVYGHLKPMINDFKSEKGFIGFADMENLHSYHEIERYNTDKKFKPIYGVRLNVCKDASERVPPRGQFGREYIFIAKNEKGIEEIYSLVKTNYVNFYYRGNISYRNVKALSKNVIVISKDPIKKIGCDYIALSQSTPMRSIEKVKEGHKCVAIVENYYPRPLDKNVYEIFTHPRNTDTKTFPQHILNSTEFSIFMKKKGVSEKIIEKSILNTHSIAKKCKGVILPKADMVKYPGKESVRFMCKLGAKRLGINIQKGKYKKRYEYELGLIEKLGFQDYFLIVGDIVKKAKKKMLVGPARGSSGGSLICYLMGITEIDPIKYGLMFERFIDINRDNLPDIDIDFPDSKRDMVVKDIIKTYGTDNVGHVGTISRMKPAISINEWAKSLRVPSFETDALKNSVIVIAGGDTRAGTSMEAALNDNEAAKEFFDKFPNMKSVIEIEEHARHSGVHAAGVIVCNKDISKYAGVNIRDNSIMCDKKGAEYLGLLKIDILGLRTLAVLEDCCDQIGMEYEKMYEIDLEDEKVFETFNSMRLEGIFQFEGYSLASLTRKMKIEEFEDIVAITSLARPGALYSGGANRYIKYRNGEEEIVHVGKEHSEITKDTYGTVVYQEQILKICREIGGMDWDGVNQIRKCVSNSYGKDFLNTFRPKFDKGAAKKGYSPDQCDFLWSEIEGSGSYAFNKSHAVAYAMISFWTAYMKTYHPKEFVVSNLRNSKSFDAALKILRDSVVNEGLEYLPVDSDESEVNWSINSEGVIVGGLTNINGIGPANARKIVSSRKTGAKLPPNLITKLIEPETEFDILFPTMHYWGDFFERPNVYGLSSPPSTIVNVQTKGHYLFVGRLIKKNIRDLNEYANLQRRDGKVLDKDSLSLAITVQDDTDSIMCNVNRFNYEEIGREIAETGVEEEDWYLIRGEIKWEGRYVDISAIMKLDESIMEKVK